MVTLCIDYTNHNNECVEDDGDVKNDIDDDEKCVFIFTWETECVYFYKN